MPLDASLRLLLLSALWGASFLFMRIAAPALGAFSTAFLRVFLGALGLLAILALWCVPWRFQGRARAALLIGVINSGIPFAMFCLAAQVLPAGYSAMFNATTPLMGVLLGAAFFAEAMTRERLLGVSLGVVGVGVLVQAGPVPVSWQLLGGALACLVAASCYGLSGFLVRRYIAERGGLDSRLLALGSQLGASLALAPLMLLETATRPSLGAWAQPDIWAAMLVLGLACTALAYLLYFRLLQDLGPVKPLTVTMLVPAFGVLWGALFLDERVTPAHGIGGALIALALWLILFKRAPRRDVGAGQKQ
ncbi:MULTISPECIES: DMT family transporter [unclassified Modicisalibacter]|uniref:DMT family transporter n=1 Tax=unclassified Modicisalibacter TaxID=2679913 RepID=UPI001CCE30DE|nr:MULTISPECIES: DMT family transporter [unclassified Modicisalibacter]MBZ9557682.1 DMT family transporter [Modicisalibacter sp. R2A 31.J]MBZ9573654.1 DMT family transporter [Modicisalibacter sp. MOD 31.J]